MASGPLEGAPLQAECEQRGFVVCPAEGFPERGRPLPGRKRGRGGGRWWGTTVPDPLIWLSSLL